MRRPQALIGTVLALVLFVLPVEAANYNVDVSLRGSPTSMMRQNDVAKELGYSFVESPAQLSELVEEGKFVRLPGNAYYRVNDGVSYPFARPEVRLFVERLAEQYYEGTGEQLVVTSLTRPKSNQPRNSHELSVHPAGIAIDLRISDKHLSRAWLEAVLLKLEKSDVLDITRERWPPHYHVAIFPDSYRAHVEEMIGTEELLAAMDYESEPEEAEAPVAEAEPAADPSKTAASAVPAVESDKPSTRMLIAALPLSALLFFLLGYWRGRKEPEEDSEGSTQEGWDPDRQPEIA